MFSTAEKIETIVLSRTSGNFGSHHINSRGEHVVKVDGVTYTVWTDRNGWSVRRKNSRLVHIHRYLLEAAHSCVSA